MASSFYKCFKARLADVGIPAPETIFGSIGVATATITAISKAVATYGTQVTLGELVGAGIVTGSVAAGIAEVVGYVGALAASFFVGVCIGAMLVCTGEAVYGALSMTKVSYSFYKRTKFSLSDDLVAIMTANPEMRGAKKSSTFETRSREYGYGSFSADNSGDSAYA